GSMQATLDKVRTEITHKFGAKGQAIVDSNMSVIEDAIEATEVVDYANLSLPKDPAERRAARTAALSAAMSQVAGNTHPTALFDPEYWGDMMARPFREGTIAEAPVLPGTGMFMPPASGIAKDKGLFRRQVPAFNPDGCTACLECALACPDSAIPTTVHELHDLLTNAIEQIDATPVQRQQLLNQVPTWAAEARRLFLETPNAGLWPSVAKAATNQVGMGPALMQHIEAIEDALEAFPVARTRPFFDAMEKERAGSGGLLSVVIDPWKCTGCLQCVAVCGPKVLTTVEQTDELLEVLQDRFHTMTTLPNSPKRFSEGAVEDGDPKRLLVDHAAYYSLTGGHGACRGCGEVTAIHLLTALNHSQGEDRRSRHVARLNQLISQLGGKLASLDPAESERRQRIEGLIKQLDGRLYLYEAGPSGVGPAPAVFANSTGCSSVYASTMPFTPYSDPWVNSLFQDAQPLAAGIYEGLASQLVDEVKALRLAEAELDDSFDPAQAKALETLAWRDFTHEEAALMPALITVSGDGAAYDIGFGALSRVLASGVPVKMMVLDTGSYSNTGGQASTASYTSQDADLARYGKAHPGKAESRKELGLIAMFHPHVFVAACSTALHAHFLEASADLLNFSDGAGLLQAFTPCGTESGFAEDLSNERARLAVESRLAPLFVHNPTKGASLQERLSLDGNPSVDALWVKTTLQYVDADGSPQLKEIDFTPADFAFGEVRFAKNFKPLPTHMEDAALPVAEFIELSPDQRSDKVAFIWATDRKQRLIKVLVSSAMVAMVEDRKRFWQSLRFLAGREQSQLSAQHKSTVTELEANYAAALAGREEAIDSIAAAMATLATSSAAPAGGLAGSLGGLLGGQAAPAAAAPAGAAPASGAGDKPIWLDPADVPKCNDCGTCYQELPALFEKATIMVDGAPQVVGRMIEGSLDGFEVTPDVAKRISRVKANCDAEIIQ
ncbi:MAG: pyruvate-flavodoxin oxidoreductase, partial [Micrococcales bacterium]|nr:pyruvate-flavodoxin oxidoreductase [Micrococcales bacterium]